jgi:predicted chitinase
MPTAVTPGPTQAIPQAGAVPAVTPGTAGRNDAADPAHAASAPPLRPGVISTPADAAASAAQAAVRPAVVAGQSQHASKCFATQALPQGLILDQDAFVTAYKAEPMLEFHSLSDATNGSSWEQNLRRFLSSMQASAGIDTVFKAAYILATAMKESRGLPTGYKMTWAPVEETHGRQSTQAYWNQVVVRDLEHWPIGADGQRIDPLPPPAAPAAAASGASAAAHGRAHHAAAAHPHPHPVRPANLTDAQLPQHFPAAKLIKNSYQGRGYVQLTWLENYVSLGVAIGMGNKLACDPSLVLDHDVAFKIAAVGMLDGCFTGRRHGPGRTGGNKLSDYSDYVDARDIINTGGDSADQVAKYARIFENLIQDSRLV